MRFTFHGVCATDTGLVRGNNEDAAHAHDAGGLYAVADGMGGHAHGERASAEAVAAAVACFAVGARTPAGVQAAMRAADRAVRAAARRLRVAGPMGPTLTLAAYAGEDRVLVGHRGDSRAYRFRRGALERLTADDGHDHLLLRYVGDGAVAPSAVVPVAVRPRDVLVLCTDGVWGPLGDAGVERLLASATTLAEARDRVMAAVRDAGAPDNATLVLVGVAGA